jgi:hypothetical protein
LFIKGSTTGYPTAVVALAAGLVGVGSPASLVASFVLATGDDGAHADSEQKLLYLHAMPRCRPRAAHATNPGFKLDFTADARLLALVGILIFPAACAEEGFDPPPTCADYAGTTQRPSIPLAHSTEHLDIHVDEGVMMCAGSADDWERFYRYVANKLDITPTQRVPVYLLRVPREEHCGPKPRLGCIKRDGVVFSNYRAIYHELVHAVACEWRQSGTKFLVEGLATAFEPGPLSYRLHPSEFVTQSPDEFGDYGAAAHFVRWLLEIAGPDTLRRAYQRAPSRGGPGVLGVLGAFYGDVDELFADYEEHAPDLWAPHRVCDDLPVLEPSGVDTWRFESWFDCDDRSTMGPWTWVYGPTADQFAHREMYQSFLIEIETPQTYRFQRMAEDYTGLRMWRCLDDLGLSKQEVADRWIEDILITDAQDGTPIELDAGVYRVDVLRMHAPPHLVTVDVFPLDPYE